MSNTKICQEGCYPAGVDDPHGNFKAGDCVVLLPQGGFKRCCQAGCSAAQFSHGNFKAGDCVKVVGTGRAPGDFQRCCPLSCYNALLDNADPEYKVGDCVKLNAAGNYMPCSGMSPPPKVPCGFGSTGGETVKITEVKDDDDKINWWMWLILAVAVLFLLSTMGYLNRKRIRKTWRKIRGKSTTSK